MDKSLTLLSNSIENIEVYPMIGDGAFFKFKYDSIYINGLDDSTIIMYPDSLSEYKTLYNKDNWTLENTKKREYIYSYIFN